MRALLLALALPGCEALDERYDTARGGCELVPMLRLVVDGGGARWDATPALRC